MGMALLIAFNSDVRSGTTAGRGAAGAGFPSAASVPVVGFFFGCASSAAFPSCPPVQPARRSAERSVATASVAAPALRTLMKGFRSNACAVLFEGRGQKAEGRRQKAEVRFGRGALL